jgi:putative hydrolase of the HAD superfamily
MLFRMIAAVLFDLDETLLDRTSSLRAFLRDQYTTFSSRLGCVAFEVWQDRFLALDARGHVHKSVVYPTLLAEFGGDPEAAQALFADYDLRCYRFARAFPGMAQTLTELRSEGFRLGIVTNGETEFQSRHIRALGLHELVDTILISQKEGLRKPDRALFVRAAVQLGVDPAYCLFVGDNPVADILGAHRAGMQTAWLSPEATWPTDLPPMPSVRISELPELLRLL